MRVLHFSGWVDPDGRSPDALLDAWPTLVEVAAAVGRAGARVTVLQAARDDAEVDRDGVRFRFVAEPRYPAPRRLLGHRAAPHPWKTLRAARRERVDVVHLHGLGFPLQARALTAGAPPVMVQDHADRPPSGIRRAIHAWGYRRVAGASFTHADLARPFLDQRVLPDVPVFEVPEGSSRFTPRRDARQRSGLDGSPAVLWVGDIAEWKDPLTALAAFLILAERHREARLWMIYRRAPMLPEVSRWLDEHPATRSRVHLLGEVEPDRMPFYLTAADVVLSTSIREGAGYAVLEALSCGTPVVVSDIPALRAAVGSLGVGRIASPRDAAAFAQALAQVARIASDDPDGVRRRVRAHFESHLSFDEVGRRLVAAYEELLAARSAA